MSDTQDAPAVPAIPALPPVANYSMRREMRGPAGKQVEHLIVTFGQPARSVTVRELGMGDQWDLSELTGDASPTSTWRSMAYTASSVQAIDGVPVPPPRYTRESIRTVLNGLGLEGARAVNRALNEATPAADAGSAPPPPGQPDPAMLAAAKN